MHTVALQLIQERKIKYSNGLYRYTQTELAYNSNHIEGSTLTREHTVSLFATDTILSAKDEIIKADDIIEMRNHFRAFDYILDNCDAEISEKMIKQLHCILLTGTAKADEKWFNVGEYKAVENMIGVDEISTCAPKDVPAAMNNLLKAYSGISNKTVEDIIDFHVKFEEIHPFQDGNGRVGRLVMFKECLAGGIMPFIIDEKHRDFYYRGLRMYPEVKGYLTDTCLSAQDKYQVVYDKLKFTLK